MKVYELYAESKSSKRLIECDILNKFDCIISIQNLIGTVSISRNIYQKAIVK